MSDIQINVIGATVKGQELASYQKNSKKISYAKNDDTLADRVQDKEFSELVRGQKVSPLEKINVSIKLNPKYDTPISSTKQGEYVEIKDIYLGNKIDIYG